MFLVLLHLFCAHFEAYCSLKHFIAYNLLKPAEAENFSENNETFTTTRILLLSRNIGMRISRINRVEVTFLHLKKVRNVSCMKKQQ